MSASRSERAALALAGALTLALPASLVGWLSARTRASELRADLVATRLAEALRLGWEAAGHEDAAAALAQAARAKELAPGSAEPWLLSARARFLALDRAALADCEEALKKEPRSAAATALLGLVRSRITAEPELARSALAAARALPTDDPRALGFRGLLAADLGDPPGALVDLDRAVALAPGDPEPFGNRASVRARQGDLRGGFEDYGRALELGPARLGWLAARGELALRLGDATTAREVYRLARERHGEALPVLVGEGNLAVLDQRWDEALARFERAAALEPGNLVPATGRIMALRTLGRLPEARRALEELRRAHPDRAEQLERSLGW